MSFTDLKNSTEQQMYLQYISYCILSYGKPIQLYEKRFAIFCSMKLTQVIDKISSCFVLVGVLLQVPVDRLTADRQILFSNAQ